MEWGRPPSATLGPALWVDYAPKERQNDFIIWVPNDSLGCHKIGWSPISITGRIGYCNSQKFAYSACFNKKLLCQKFFKLGGYCVKSLIDTVLPNSLQCHNLRLTLYTCFRPNVSETCKYSGCTACRVTGSTSRRGALGGMAAKKVVTATWWPVVAV